MMRCLSVFCLAVLAWAVPPLAESAGHPGRVVVIGAGLAGLNGALLLEAQGYEVTVLEARERVGGRLYTLDEVPGTPEAGGNVIGPSYARIIDRAKALGVALVPAPQIAGGPANISYYINGQFLAPAAWPASAANPFPAALKRLPPGSALFGVLRDNPLAAPADWRTPAAAVHDVPVQALFEQLGFDERGQHLANHSNSYGNSLADTSLLALYRIAAAYALGSSLPGQPMAVAGGNQRLPEAMAGALAGDLHLGKWVSRIAQDEQGVTVHCRDGSDYRADYVLVTVPLPALRAIDIQPPLPDLQQRAVAELNYTSTLLAFFTVTGPYWGDHTPSLWTDTPAERLFASADDSGRVQNLTLWITGEEALAFGALPDAERDRQLAEALYAIYPEARGRVSLAAVRDWHGDSLAGGSWLRWQPGQITAFAEVLAQPAGRLFFAGEHTAVANTGMEGAMESAERAVAEITAAADRPSGEALFVHCQGCHSIYAGAAHKLGPNLSGFFGQPRASRPGYNYSEALAAAGGRWDRETLAAWLANPQAAVPGNRMIYSDALGSAQREALLDYLERAGR